MEYVVEPEKNVPIAHKVDVAVAGGGIAGMMAALAAARNGARTLIIDRFGRLGGNVGPGMWAGGSLHLALTPESKDDDNALVNILGMGGIPEEFVRRALSFRLTESQLSEDEGRHFNVPGRRLGTDYFAHSYSVSHVATKMMEEEGVTVMLSTQISNPIVREGRVVGLFIENKSGRQAVLTKIIIDATGDAEVARRAGLNTKWSGGNPGIGLFYALAGVDWKSFRAASGDGELKEADRRWMEHVMEVHLGYPTHGLESLIPYARKAWEDGTYRIVQDVDGIGRVIIRPLKEQKGGLTYSRAETNGKLDPGSAAHISLLERRIRQYIFETVHFLKVYVPGFSDCYLHSIAPYLGARGGRWIEAEYPLSAEDVMEGRRFHDVIYVYHDRRAQTATDVPYRALVPKGIDGLLAAGRSASPRPPNLRARYSMLLMGQAAGIAAALCVKKGIQPRELDPKDLQRMLVKWGCPLGDEARIQELGLI